MPSRYRGKGWLHYAFLFPILHVVSRVLLKKIKSEDCIIILDRGCNRVQKGEKDLCELITGMNNLKPKKRSLLIPTWSLPLVLNAQSKATIEPLSTASMKFVQCRNSQGAEGQSAPLMPPSGKINSTDWEKRGVVKKKKRRGKGKKGRREKKERRKRFYWGSLCTNFDETARKRRVEEQLFEKPGSNSNCCYLFYFTLLQGQHLGSLRILMYYLWMIYSVTK